MTNSTIFQFFHWYISNDGNWWNYCASQAKHLASLGFTHVYLPPAYKSAMGVSEPGYAVYDLYDLGEFDQKGTVRTKYGTRDEYLKCIDEFHNNNIAVIADIVMNHRYGGDEEESIKARAVNPENRNEFVSEESEIKAYTKFKFPGRQKNYSAFEWDHNAFSGIDKKENDTITIYSILNQYGDKWEDMLEDENGNFDFLMGADVEFRNEFVREELKGWGKWYADTAHLDGFRLDAVKHISPMFIKEWLFAMSDHFQKPFFCVSEYWRQNVDILLHYLDTIENRTCLFDVPLHYNFREASLQKNEYDLRTILDQTLTQLRPEMSVTFVENHDTQPLQSLESPVDYWFKPLAYAIILLREQGTPMVFLPCLYGSSYSDDKDGQHIEINLAIVKELEAMLCVRKNLAYGKQADYFDHYNVVGWVRQGIEEKPGSGCAVLLSNGDDGFKEMDMGMRHAGKTFIDACGNVEEELTANEKGQCQFLVKANSVSVWVNKEI